MTMTYVRLGSSGLEVSRLCLGCMTYGSPQWRPWVLDERAAKPFLKRALELGVNFFDTANFYSRGQSERVLGKVLKGLDRDAIVVATKVGLEMGEGANRRGLSRKHVLEQIDASLERLGMDYVDLYQVHRLDGATPLEETLDALNDVVRAGKALYLGASSMAAWEFMRCLAIQEREGFARFVSMQNFYNLLYREEEREMLPLCRAEGIGVIPWSPLARGFLAGNRPQRGKGTQRGATDTIAQGWFGTEQDYAIAARVAEVAGRLGRPPAQVALAWVASRPGVTAPIIGASKAGQLEDAVAALELALDAETVQALEEPYRPRAVMGIN